MTQKEQLALFISEKKHDHNEWIRFCNTHPFVRIRTVGSNGDVQINLEKDAGWLDPRDWLVNYVGHNIVSFVREAKRLKNIASQEQISQALADSGIVTNTPKAPEQIDVVYVYRDQIKAEINRAASGYFKVESFDQHPFKVYRDVISSLAGGTFEEQLYSSCVDNYVKHNPQLTRKTTR